MSLERPEGLRKELLDDFYSECDELLTGIRRSITALESYRGNDADSPELEELFRAMHSLKGNCAIAGVQPGEELAHAVEDLLRAITTRQIVFFVALPDLLLVATERLNKIIVAHRQNKPLPSIGDLLSQLAQPLPQASSAPAAPPRPIEPAAKVASDPVAAARTRGLKIWRIIFVPSPALDQRGVGIESVRQRLAQIGEILSATPFVQPGGLRFVFMLGARTISADLSEWEKDGITFEALEAPSASPAPAAGAATEDQDALNLTPSHIVRVDLGQLDDLMRITGEMIIQRSRLEDRLGQRQVANDDLKDIDLALARSLRDLRAVVSRVRLVPVSEIFSRMPYVLRDLARGSAKRARMTLHGEQTEIDKFLVERLKEPLLHLVRNAFAHGVQAPAERVAAGKPAEATIELKAVRVGDSVEIQVSDDGGGIDVPAVAARAKSLGLKMPEPMDDAGLLGLLCHPGFSTREVADRAAGRGVGMTVVRNAVRELGGSLRLRTDSDRGTEFTLRLPLTLSIADALIVQVESQLCALPQSHLEEIFQVSSRDVRTIQQTEVAPWRGALLPVTRLRRLFGFPPAAQELLTVIVVGSERGSTGLVVDRVRSRREIVIRALSDPLVRAPGIGGATELGDGRPILVLDPASITAGVVRPSTAQLTLAVAGDQSTS